MGYKLGRGHINSSLVPIWLLHRVYNINYKSNSQPMNTESAVLIQIYNVVQGISN